MDIVGDHLINLITSDRPVSILFGVSMDPSAMSLTLGISLFLEPLDGVVVLVHLKLLLADLILTELIEVLKLGNLFSKLVVGDLKSQDIFVEMLDRVVQFSKLSVQMVKLGELFLALKFELSQSLGLLQESFSASFNFRQTGFELDLDVSYFLRDLGGQATEVVLSINVPFDEVTTVTSNLHFSQ